MPSRKASSLYALSCFEALSDVCKARPVVEEDDEEEEEDTPASRLVAVVLKHLLKALPAKDKTIRFRACQLVAMMTSGLGELEYVVECA